MNLIDITDELENREMQLLFFYPWFTSEIDRTEYWVCSTCYRAFDYELSFDRKFETHCPYCSIVSSDKEALDRCRLVGATDQGRGSRKRRMWGRLINFLFNWRETPTLQIGASEKSLQAALAREAAEREQALSSKLVISPEIEARPPAESEPMGGMPAPDRDFYDEGLRFENKYNWGGR